MDAPERGAQPTDRGALGRSHREARDRASALVRLRREPLALLALGVLALLSVVALAAPWLAEGLFGTSQERIELDYNLQAPSSERPAWWLGTDEYGRSQLVRLMYGGRVSLGFAAFVVLMNLTLGATLGMLAGYYRGKLDDLITWVIITINAIPGIFVLLLVAVLFRPGPVALGVAFSLLAWTGAARLVRGQVFSLREREFVIAAGALGARDGRIMLRHILPNVTPLLIIFTGRGVAGVILGESALSYLGLGIQPPVASWGNMLTNAQSYLFHAWWLVLGPGLLITLTVLCLYILADGLRDALDPRLRQ